MTCEIEDSCVGTKQEKWILNDVADLRCVICGVYLLETPLVCWRNVSNVLYFDSKLWKPISGLLHFQYIMYSLPFTGVQFSLVVISVQRSAGLMDEIEQYNL